MLLGLDLGTGSVKALLLSRGGATLGEASAEYEVRAPHTSWAESDPNDWWRAVGTAVREAASQEGAEGQKVEAVGLSGQMHGVVLADGGGNPLRPAVLWADARARAELDRYRELDEEALLRLANPPATGMAGPSLLWLRDNERASYSSARWALQPKDWLRLRLTGEAASEPSDASATLLYDLAGDDWDLATVGALGLRDELLARLVASDAVAGTLTSEAAQHLGLKEGVPVAAGAADTAAAMLGTGLLGPGEAQLTVGTGAQIVSLRTAPNANPGGVTHLYRTARGAPLYAMAAVQNAGLALEWVRRVAKTSWEEVYDEAFSVPPGAGGVIFLPYLSGERTPLLDPDARGAWFGLGLEHERAHLLRAALEGVAFAIRDGMEALEASGERLPELRLAGGGTGQSPWRQMLADVLARPLVPLVGSAASVASARGAALLGGLASGALENDPSVPEREPRLMPGEDRTRYDDAYARYRELVSRNFPADRLL